MSLEPPPVAPPPPPNPPAAPPAAPASGVGEVWSRDWIQPDFKLNQKALDRLPDHLKGMAPTLGKYQTLEDVLVGFQNQQVMAGKKALAPLPADAPAAVVAERKALLDTINGVPKEFKDYGITKPADLPDQQWNQPLADAFSKWAQENSVPPTAAKKLLAIQTEAVKGQLAQQEQYEQQYYAEEQKAFDATIKASNIAADKANALVEKGAIALGLDLASDKTKNFLKGADARLMAMKHAIAIGEDTATLGQPADTGRDYAAMAKSIISNKADPLNAAYWNLEGKYSRTDHDAAVAKHQEYLQLAEAKNAPASKGRR